MNIWRTLPFPKYLVLFLPVAMAVHHTSAVSPLWEFAIAGAAILGSYELSYEN